MSSIWWLLLFVLLLLFEVITVGLTTIWFAAGAFITYIVTLLGADLEIQVSIFFLSSIILIIFIRPITAKYLKVEPVQTNIDSYIGQTAKTIADINNLQSEGAALIHGQMWTARSIRDELIIPAGTIVTVREICGVKLIVEPKEVVKQIKED